MHPRNVIREGDKVRARVIAVDGAKRRIALDAAPAVDPQRANSYEPPRDRSSWELDS